MKKGEHLAKLRFCPAKSRFIVASEVHQILSNARQFHPDGNKLRICQRIDEFALYLGEERTRELMDNNIAVLDLATGKLQFLPPETEIIEVML
ncbi:MAG: hypothetical protein A2359_02975 [Candidatus Moranbacteria bacterium RIFOXYB1_FULL_43_19]|nr:MAG: hypothetical protein A2359_02975 [Candidatus Moranbacteria bacterium RIFOXYB1_FULL_43_19]OGI28944.1 MAG: hypothetical protein A2184_00895 [Candidatus Moranbacteria bacterium RIFOXYA1_FULL_44_7]OGI33641.1 MAG: hypothetical protein A2420_02235 [Candidatus Moranbacteria bacterium RIFOXYC1_FULL_44_13]OGI37184.1 MAG: hypothetical protein A2612_03840 [Candidatus Moranbacteria bacterium RIFOXYD1_FULL_44_12]